MNSTRCSLCIAAAAAFLLALPAAGQQIVSARSGAIHHIEGKVLMDDEPVVAQFGKFPQLKENSVLRTELGRAEMLLTPGVIVRLAEDSAVRMVNSRLTDTRVEFLKGSAMVEAMEILKDNAVTFTFQNATIALEKAGLYRLDSDPPVLRVYKGKARIRRDDQVIEAKGGRLVELGAFLVATKFDTKQGGPLYRWSSRRSGYLAMANVSAARSIYNWGLGWDRPGWRWNPYFGMFTFVPSRGVFSSPFGYRFWSPARVYVLYQPPRQAFSSGGGWGRGGSGVYSASHGYVVVGSRSAPSAGSVSSGSVSAAPAASPRTAGSASPRTSSGRGR